MNEKIPPGRFVWYECLTTDPAGAQAFYAKLVGWNPQPFEGGPMPYTMMMKGDTPVGGVMQLPDEAKQQGAPSHWLGYVSTPDVDKTLADATAAGATDPLWPHGHSECRADGDAGRPPRRGVRCFHSRGRGTPSTSPSPLDL